MQEIKDPYHVKSMSLQDCIELASSLRSQILQVTAENGGHLSSNLGVIEMTIALHRNFDFPQDKLLFDVGHQCYAHKLLSGRSLETLRKKDGISGFQKRTESPYDCFEAGHSSTSLSAALGMAYARDLNQEKYHIIAFIGDASIVSGEAFEALNAIGHCRHKVIIVLNDNEMSISKPVGSISKLFSKIRISFGYNRAKGRYQRFLSKTRVGYRFYCMTANVKNSFKRLVIPMNYFDNLGIDYIGPINGHDFKALDKAFSKAKKNNASCLIHCHTVKGKGYPFAEQDKEGAWHGVGPFHIEDGTPKKKCDSPSWSKIYSDLVDQFMEKDERLVYINPAMIRGSEAENIFLHYPSRAIDAGIAEEHAISFASGLSLSGKHPIIAMYSTFLQRGFDQINQDLCRMDLPCTLLIDRSGVVGADGETHQGIYDEAFLVSTPNMIVTMAGNATQAKQLFQLSLQAKHPFAIRFPRECLSESADDEPVLAIGTWLWKGRFKHPKICVGVGPLFLQLSKQAREKGIACDFLQALFMKPMDTQALSSLLSYQEIHLYQPYATRYGWIQSVLSYLMENHYLGKVHVHSLPDVFIKQATIMEQLSLYSLSVDQMLEILQK